MAVKSTPLGSGTTLPAEVVTALTEDWSDDRVKSGTIDPDTKSPFYSEVRMPMGTDPTFKSNRAFDCLQVVKGMSIPARKGWRIGTKTEVEVVTPAVDEVLDKEGKVVTPATPAVEVLVVRTMWKPVK